MSSGRIPCPSRAAVDLWYDPDTKRAKGRCGCGYEGWMTRSGHLYSHSREVPGFTAPGLTRYTAAYSVVTFAVTCQECGSIVADTDIHDDFHNTLVEDLNLIRRELVGDPIRDREQRVRGEPRHEGDQAAAGDQRPHAADRSGR